MQTLYRCSLVAYLLFCTAFTTQLYASEHVVLQLRWHHQFQFAGYYVAKDRGYYQQAGLDVEIKPIQQGLSIVDEVISGRAHFSQGNVGLLIDRAQGVPVVAVSAIFQKSPSTFITLSKSGILAPEDMAGKRVMLMSGNSSIELLALLRRFQLTDKIIRLNSSTHLEDLIQGNTDVFNGYMSNEPYTLQNLGYESKTINPADYGIQFYSDILFTSEKIAKEKPAMVEAFRQASIKGWQWAIDHPEDTINLILNQYTSQKDRHHLRYEANIIRQAMMTDVVEIGHMNTQRWLNIQSHLRDLGMINQNIDLSEFIFTRDDRPVWKTYEIEMLSILILIIILVCGVWFLAWSNRRLGKEVVQHSEAEERAWYVATHDQLTGLPNRSLFLDRLLQTTSRAKREGTQPALLFIDLDNFKLINDKYGHKAGDQALVTVASSLLDNIRESDNCARYAGDEFVVLLDHCSSKEDAIKLATKCRIAIKDRLGEVG